MTEPDDDDFDIAGLPAIAVPRGTTRGLPEVLKKLRRLSLVLT